MSTVTTRIFFPLAFAILSLLVFREPKTHGDERTSKISSGVDVNGDKAESKWGNLSGQILYDGDLPQPKLIQAAGRPIRDESLVVDPKTFGVANVGVWVYLARYQKLTAIHPDEAEVPQQPAFVQIIQDRYQPHILIARTQQSIRFQSLVPYGSNVSIATYRNPLKSLLLAPGDKMDVKFLTDESVPVAITDNIHPWLKAFLIVKSHPYVAISGTDGRFLIRNLPAGTHTFQVWHESIGYVQEPHVDNEPVKWERGRFKFEVKQGDNSLGQVKIKGSLFKR